MSYPSSVYLPRKPQDSQYYQFVEDHFKTLDPRRGGDERFAKQYGFFRPYVRQVIYRYLDCGILHNGFVRVKWHPHLHVLCTDGCFCGNGIFRVAPLFELKHLEEIFRHKVFKMLLSKSKITEDLVDMLMKWRHSGSPDQR